MDDVKATEGSKATITRRDDGGGAGKDCIIDCEYKVTVVVYLSST